MKKYTYILIILFNFIFADESTNNRIYYFQPGPNLVSFDILPNNSTIENIFSSTQDNIISIISSGEVSYNNSDNWVGNLTNLNSQDGYWVVTSDVVLINLEGLSHSSNVYYLYSGANLISYPFDNTQEIEQALPFYMYNNLSAIIGQNEAALILDGEVAGSLTHFEPNKGYWFLTNNAIPFQYNNPIETDLIYNPNQNTYDNEQLTLYNQSIMQSVFFVENAFHDGNTISTSDQLLVKCNDIIVGARDWSGNMTDIIAMGNDGYEQTENYCQDLQDVSIFLNRNEILNEMHIIGNTEWNNNNISIISLSNFELGDINLDDNINITDIIIIIDHIISNNMITNSHQLMLSDLNNDEIINITDIIFITDLIIR